MRAKTRSAGWLVLIIGLLSLIGCHPIVPVTCTSSSKIALKSFHGWYVTALGEDSGWALKQASELSDCAWFTPYDLADGKIALRTCYGRYVTAPRRGSTRYDWEVWQDSGLGDCGQFALVAHSDGVALKTCAEKYLTAGDGNWEPPLQWSMVAETDKLQAWEVFTVLPAKEQAP